MKLFIICALFFVRSHQSLCPPCKPISLNCFQLDKAIVILGTCLPDQIFKGCYEIGELTSCCCAPATPKITAPETTIKAPSNIQCPDCTPTSNDCYLTDPFIPSLGYCLAGYDFYGCYDKNGDITKCCCKPNIQTDCTISGLRS